MAEDYRGRGVWDRVAIAAPPEAVWQRIAAIDGWGNWNPLYIEAKGEARVGARIEAVVALEGMKPQKAVASVLAVEPGERLLYRTSNLGGLVRATRYIILTPLAGGETELLNGEVMEGLLGRLLGKAIGAKVRKGLAGMNLALKERVETGL
jgi:hypothetical protein